MKAEYIRMELECVGTAAIISHAMAAVVDDEEVMRTVVSVDEAIQRALELSLGVPLVI